MHLFVACICVLLWQYACVIVCMCVVCLWWCVYQCSCGSVRAYVLVILWWCVCVPMCSCGGVSACVLYQCVLCCMRVCLSVLLLVCVCEVRWAVLGGVWGLGGAQTQHLEPVCVVTEGLGQEAPGLGSATPDTPVSQRAKIDLIS